MSMGIFYSDLIAIDFVTISCEDIDFWQNVFIVVDCLLIGIVVVVGDLKRVFFVALPFKQ